MSTDYTVKPDLGDLSPNQFFDYHNSPFDVEEHRIYQVVSGSRAYGMSTPTSDVDVRGVVVPPLRYFMGLNNFEQVENQSKDVCFYSLKKFVQLAYKNNVHAMEMLFMDPETVTYVHPVGQMLLDNRHMFPSKLLGYSIGGYAHQQLMVMRTKQQNGTGRQELITKHGMDTKMAAHAIRLFRMGTEALSSGDLKVKRPDAAELLEIRAGKYSPEEFAVFEEVVSSEGKKRLELTGGFAFQEKRMFDEAFAASKLPTRPDFQAIEALTMRLHDAWFASRA